MQIYEQALDPNETRDFTQDWTGQLAAGDEITAIADITFVDAAGTTQPTAASFTATGTRVWLTGGTAGSRAIFTVRVTTQDGRTLEEAYAVNIADSTSQSASETDIERLTREIAEAKAQRALVAQGKAVIEAWRDGRRIRRAMPTLEGLEAYIRQLRGELLEAQVAAGVEVTPRRSAIGTGYA